MGVRRDVLCLHPPPCWVRPPRSPVSVTEERMLLSLSHLNLISHLVYITLFSFSLPVPTGTPACCYCLAGLIISPQPYLNWHLFWLPTGNELGGYMHSTKI